MDLFEQHRLERLEAEAPLAARMRPRTLDEFVGQNQIIGPGRLLRRAIQIDQLSSLIFYGPPGTGKTTLARIIAGTTRAHFIAINAVLAGVKEIRSAIEVAQERRGKSAQRTILFIDEVHRFNKSQQDALLPWVENGTLTLIGATTENPYFEVNKALVSRSRLFQLKLLESVDMRAVARQALEDPVRGYGNRPVQLDPEALDHLVDVSGGDARTLLNALELAVETTELDSSGQIRITLAIAEESIQRRAVLYDKEGDAHFDTVSAYIKSLRGSDPDAALYWLARMLYAGEDPRFIFRRLLIQASEDVGLADPRALGVVTACADAFDRVGLPEGRYHLAQATLYLATAPKSNSTMAFFDALAAVEREQAALPNHLKDASRDKEGFGHGAGYLYPHAYRDHWVAQQYLPTNLQGQVFFQPSDQGFEAQLKAGVERRREAQLAALAELRDDREVLTFGPTDNSTDRWLQRTLSRMGEQLGELRDRVFALALPARHHLVLDLGSSGGLLTWEALRQVPEGGVYTITRTLEDATALREQVEALPALIRPVILTAAIDQIAEAIELAGGLRFDRIVGRNALRHTAARDARLCQWLPLLAPGGLIVLAESVPRRAQRLYQLLEPAWLGNELYTRIVAAEEAIYAESPLLQDAEDLRSAFQAAGFSAVVSSERMRSELRLTSSLLGRWFAETDTTYATQLARLLEPAEVKTVQSVFEERLLGQVVAWESTTALLQARL